MLPEGTEVMRRLACADVCPAQESPTPAPPHPHPRPHADSERTKPQENKELLRQQLLSTVSKTASAEPINPTPRVKQTRNRQKNRWKLKFHHQALPPEYLDHYEQSLQKSKTKAVQEKQQSSKVLQENSVKLEPEFDLVNFTNESLRLWTERLSNYQRNMTSQAPSNSQINSPILNSMINMSAPKAQKLESDKRKKPNTPAIAPSKIVTYDDLPYMGEMTLNNSKPRRGRKPKKADICHLIYENYGTIVPGQPIPSPDEKHSQLSMCDSFRKHMKPETDTITSIQQANTSRTDLQNRIISSLLERKMTQEKKREESSKNCSTLESSTASVSSDSGPLNLCIRDMTDLKIQIQKKFGNMYSSLPELKTEMDHVTPDDSLTTSNAISVIQRNTNLFSPSSEKSPDMSRYPGNVSPALSEPARAPQPFDVDGKLALGYVYWPDAGMYLHPMALQAQLLSLKRLVASEQLPKSLEDNLERSIPSTPNSTVSESTSTDLSTPPAEENKSKKLVLKQISDLLDPKVSQSKKQYTENSKLKRASPNPPAKGQMKRKRSAIFIPPMPVKSNSSTPTTEVSICKFKFTGGSKPSLQEKKMLSVDSGGNFRYYNGTGNKASRGYEYFQRDAVTQESASSQANTFSGAKSHTLTECKHPDREQGSSSALVNALASQEESENRKKKRKSRKSLQREKLEQTFKEKGFLIQTQQLQSAEGATYCKFRQLRKFTRYLFRSWKDYLPGNLDGGERSQQTEPPVTPETPGEPWS